MVWQRLTCFALFGALCAAASTACTATKTAAIKRQLSGKSAAAASTPTPVPATASTSTGTGTAATAPSCSSPNPPAAFVTAVIQDLSGGNPTAAELALAQDPAFSRSKFVDQVLTTSRGDDGITRFVGSLFRVSNIAPDPNKKDDPEESALVADLVQEPTILALRNKDKPWSYLWQTRDVFCTTRTAKLYNYPLIDNSGFVSCTLPPERAGFLGLVSVLRATSTSDNPQAFYRNNNNYHRVAATIYFAKGIQLLAKTNGPTGSGKGVPMADCVPLTDQRTGTGGLVFGTAAIPLSGPVCASCHSPDMGPLSIAFRKFDTVGNVIASDNLQNLLDQDTTTPLDQLQAILAESSSCWSADGVMPPSVFDGESGLGTVIAQAPTLGHALGVQIPQMLSNVTADQPTIDAITQSYDANGGTLFSAMRGYFLSPNYQCASH